jgi:genome maintenance exonuclease 1
MAEQIRRVEKNGLRFYRVTIDGEVLGEFPSITTILGETSDKSGLEKWRKRVGEEEADRISELSRQRGTMMHRLIELYKPLQGTKQERLDQLKSLVKTDPEINEVPVEFHQPGWDFFYKFYYNSSMFFDQVAEVIAAEKFLWSKYGYAGTVDNVSRMITDKILVIDYKNSRKPKQEAWIQDYFIQGSAYFVAIWERLGVKPDGVEIWIANEQESMPQTFTLTSEDVKYYFQQFINRLKQFNTIHNV